MTSLANVIRNLKGVPDVEIQWCREHNSRNAYKHGARDRCEYFLLVHEDDGLEPWCKFEARLLTDPPPPEPGDKPVWI